MARVDLVTTEEAARALVVSVQQVRRLSEDGSLSRVARGLIDRTSLDRYVAERRGGRTRVWAEPTAWAAIAFLTGDDPPWVGPTQRSRLRGTLRQITDADELVVRARSRAQVRTFSGHRAAVARLRTRVATTDATTLGLVPLDPQDEALEGYLSAGELPVLVRSLGLRADPTGAIVIRATAFDFDVVADLASRSTALAALDAATSIDPRVRGVGLRALAEVLDGSR